MDNTTHKEMLTKTSSMQKAGAVFTNISILVLVLTLGFFFHKNTLGNLTMMLCKYQFH